MDKYDYRKIDKWIERDLRDSNNIFDWNPRMTNQEPPPKTELLLIGRVTLDIRERDIWLEVPNPEYDCEVILD